jgi:hypothetical protein
VRPLTRRAKVTHATLTYLLTLTRDYWGKRQAVEAAYRAKVMRVPGEDRARWLYQDCLAQGQALYDEYYAITEQIIREAGRVLAKLAEQERRRG